jgi:hypothetical protein
MLAAGATERDLDVLAVLLVLRVIMLTERDSSDRRDLIECIARHVAGTSMVIRIGGGPGQSELRVADE